MRETECFSMYSDISTRTIALSSSNMNSARAFASSVLPTPVGPRKIKLPMGRLGSLSPARLRRIALATSETASSCPTTRSCRRPSIWMSFCTSPSSMRETGMPVHLATIWAMSSSSISSFRSAVPDLMASRSWLAASMLRSISASLPYLSCAAFSQSPACAWRAPLRRGSAPALP